MAPATPAERESDDAIGHRGDSIKINTRTEIIGSIAVVVVLTSVKILLVPSYRSTDFDVHRNWLATTRTLPLERWYFDDFEGRTVHTLDYPPSFAFFERLLSTTNPVVERLLASGALDADCLAQREDGAVHSVACVAFQRSTVILSDVLLLAGARYASRSVHGGGTSTTTTTTLLLATNAGLLLLDHVHFQYNGMLLGVLLFSLGALCRAIDASGDEGRYLHHLIGAVAFAALLTAKHLYLTLAPLYFVYLLRNVCFTTEISTGKVKRFRFGRLVGLGIATLTTLAAPFVPFLVSLETTTPAEQLTQILRRLFPFSRGLCHDYWAANVWALYSFVNRTLSKVLPSPDDDRDSFLPSDLPPSVVAGLLLLSMVPVLVLTWSTNTNSVPGDSRELRAERKRFLLRAVTHCALCSFMLAYHVHEKAIMTAVIPATLIAASSRSDARFFLRLSTLGHFALLPLLFRPVELVFKTSVVAGYAAVSLALLELDRFPGLTTVTDRVGAAVLVGLWSFVEVAHPLLFRGRMEFLPLMATSVICAVGLVGCWIWSAALLWESSRWCRETAIVDGKRKSA